MADVLMPHSDLLAPLRLLEPDGTPVPCPGLDLGAVADQQGGAGAGGQRAQQLDQFLRLGAVGARLEHHLGLGAQLG